MAELEEVAANDPFAPENIGIVQFIMLGRIYDALMALLREANPEVATDLLEMHMQGNLMGPQPMFNGVFITDEVNLSQSDEVNTEQN